MHCLKLKQDGLTLMIVIVFSKLIGMIRDVVLANYFGTTNVSDAYLIASSVPVLLFYFIGHSLSTAYIPMYIRVKTIENEGKAQKFTDNLLTIALLLSTFIVIILLLFPRGVVKLFAYGFDTATANIATRLIRISAPSIYLMSIVQIYGGYLNANKNFLPPALISLPRNFAIVVSIVLAASLGTDLMGWGLLASYFLEFFFLLPFVLKKGYRYKPFISFKDENIKQTLYIVLPILVGMCVGQVNKIIDRSMASTIINGGISALSYASILNNAVQEVLVTGIITILFSNCAELVAKGENEKVRQKLSLTVNRMIFLIVPASIGIIVLAEPIVSLVLCRGSFNQESLKMTAGALRCYTVGLLFLALRDTFVKVFYAYKKTKITTAISIISILLNIVLNIVLSKIGGINGLAIATSISAIVNCLVLYIYLKKELGCFTSRNLFIDLLKASSGAVVMGIFIYYIYRWFIALLDSEMGALLISIIIGVAIYFLIELLVKNSNISKKEQSEGN